MKIKVESLKHVIDNLPIWQLGDHRALHKPLLLLFDLGRVSRGELRKVKYELFKDDLSSLRIEFGSPRVAYSSRYPFTRL